MPSRSCKPDPATIPAWLHQTKTTDRNGHTFYGFELCGAAIGQQGFIRHYLESRVDKIVAEVRDHSARVSQQDAQVAHALNRLSWQTKPDYLIATHPRCDTARIIERLDETTRQAFEDALAISATSPDGDRDGMLEPGLSAGRLFAPARHCGTGVLRLQDRADAIFVSTLLDCLPAFIDRITEKGGVIPGICTITEPVFGKGAFDDGRAAPWATFFGENPATTDGEVSTTARELKAAIERLIWAA